MNRRSIRDARIGREHQRFTARGVAVEPRGQRTDFCDFGHTIAPALLACCNGDLAPTLRSLGFAPFGRSLTTYGNDRNDCRDTQLDRFAYDEVHHVGGDDRLHERHRVRRFALDRVECADANRNVALVDPRDLGHEFSAVAREQCQRIAHTHPQRLRDVPCGLARNVQLAALIVNG